MTTKYFRVENALQPVGGIRFTPYALIGGTHVGVYATDDVNEQGILGSAGGTCTEISVDEYESALKKKPHDSALISTPFKETPQPGLRLKGTHAAVVRGEGEEPEGAIKVDTKVETVDQALTLEEAKPGNDPAPEPLPKNRAKGKRENQ